MQKLIVHNKRSVGNQERVQNCKNLVSIRNILPLAQGYPFIGFFSFLPPLFNPNAKQFPDPLFLGSIQACLLKSVTGTRQTPIITQ